MCLESNSIFRSSGRLGSVRDHPDCLRSRGSGIMSTDVTCGNHFYLKSCMIQSPATPLSRPDDINFRYTSENKYYVHKVAMTDKRWNGILIFILIDVFLFHIGDDCVYFSYNRDAANIDTRIWRHK